MTEQAWIACTKPQKMLEFVRGKASGRKMRLLACACCRRIWHLLSDQYTRPVVELAERYTDGSVSESEWAAAYYALVNHHATLANRPAANIAVQAVLATTAPYLSSGYHRRIANGIYNACRAAARTFDEITREFDSSDDCRNRQASEEASQADLLREILGNPFQPIAFDPVCLTPTVKTLAAAIYDEPNFGGLSILADALEEAGCTNPDIFHHCRQPTEHVLGCWVIELILAKQ